MASSCVGSFIRCCLWALLCVHVCANRFNLLVGYLTILIGNTFWGFFDHSICFTFSHELIWHECGEHHVNLFLMEIVVFQKLYYAFLKDDEILFSKRPYEDCENSLLWWTIHWDKVEGVGLRLISIVSFFH